MKENKIKWKCRYAPSLGSLENTPENIWGTEEYGLGGSDHSNFPTVFFGLYGLPDFYTLWRHKGRKCILWAGTDITNFLKGYWLDGEGKITMDPKPLAAWIKENLESKVRHLKKMVSEENGNSGTYEIGQRRGLIDAFEYCIEELKKYPRWVFIVREIGFVLLGMCIGALFTIAAFKF